MIKTFGTLFNDVLDVIEDWKPKQQYNNEEGYRDDLMDFLRKELNKPPVLGIQENIKIKKESGRSLVDIGINEKIGIELKKDFKKQANIDRLVGQLRRYKKDYEDIVIVLVGKTNDEALDELKEARNELEDNGIVLQQQKIEIINKGGVIASQDDEKKDIFGFPKVNLGF